MDFRQRLAQGRPELVSIHGSSETDDQQGCTYFAIDWNKPPVCLELRLPNGSRKAIPYSYFTEINFDADAGIEILTSQKCIAVTGRNLTKLYENLITYRVKFIQANFGNDPQEDGVFVAEINISEL